MSAVELTEILINARQESNRMRHYYIGVEHLFIALLEIQGGLARSIVEELGLTPDYISDSIRRKIGKGGQRRLWSGTPSTPRANVVLDIASDLALEDGRTGVNERDILTAIIEESDNMPVRVLRALGVDMQHMLHMAQTHSLTQDAHRTYVAIDFNPQFDFTLSDEHLLILRRMFYTYARLRIESLLDGGYSGALVLAITPIHADGREDASAIVKIAETESILDEVQRYDRHVKGILPPLTARLENRPITTEISNLAGISYTIVTQPGQPPRNLRDTASEITGEALGRWLKDQLYNNFGHTWWQQKRPFRFQVWTEYDWLLPPLLTLQAVEDATTPDHVLRVPVNRARLNDIESGQTIALENFTIHRVDHDGQSLQLISGRGSEATRRAYKIVVKNVDLKSTMHFRGEVVDRIVGRVWKTRDEALFSAVDILEPPFDLSSANIHLQKQRTLINPLRAYHELLQYHLNGATSKIHGDLHLGNILVGPNNSAFLIDFAHAREGHTVFDWATLEISLLVDLVQPAVGESWDDVAMIIDQLAQATPPQAVTATTRACVPVFAVREIAGESLAQQDSWEEYYVALALCALRAVSWDTLSVGSRRLAFLVAALATTMLHSTSGSASSIDQTTPDGITSD